MSEKTTERRWRINSRAVLEVLYEGRWETAGSRWAYPDNGHNQRFREAVADACGDIDALTSERDEAVREATEANERAAAADWLHGALLRDVDCTETSGLADEFLRRMMRIDNGETPNIEAVRVAGELRAKAALADEAAKTLLPFMQTTIHYGRAKDWLARYAFLTASTGGSSEEPQKEIRE